MERTEFSKIMRELNIAYGDWKFPLTKDTVGIWNKYLCEYGFEEISASVEHHIRSSAYPPTIAELLQYAEETRQKKARGRAQKKDIYLSVVAHYPLARDTEELRETYGKLTGWDIYKGNAVLQKVISAVREWEAAGTHELPALGSFLEGLKI